MQIVQFFLNVNLMIDTEINSRYLSVFLKLNLFLTFRGLANE